MAFLKNLLTKVQEYVKLLPWLQYVGLQVSQIPGISERKAIIAASASLAAFVFAKSALGTNDVKLREVLGFGGYVALFGGAVSHHPVVQFVGAALVMTEIVYNLIYP